MENTDCTVIVFNVLLVLQTSPEMLSYLTFISVALLQIVSSGKQPKLGEQLEPKYGLLRALISSSKVSPIWSKLKLASAITTKLQKDIKGLFTWRWGTPGK